MRKIQIVLAIGLILGLIPMNINVLEKKHMHYGGDLVNIEYASGTNHSNLVNYFKNLTGNFGNNITQSSCGYVAMGMMLTYYDAMFHKDIVPSSYDRKGNYATIRLDLKTAESPGSEFDPYSSFNNPQVYWDYLFATQTSVLHAKLAIIGTTFLGLTSSLGNMEYIDVFGTDLMIDIYTISEYLDSLSVPFEYNIVYKSYNKNDSEYGNVNSYGEVFEFIKTEIDEGRPVLIGFDHHASIAYDYTLTMNQEDYNIFLHYGYLNKTSVQNTHLCLSYLNDINNINSNDTSLTAISLQLDNSLVENPDYNYHSTIYNDDNSYRKNYINHYTHIYGHDYEYLDTNYHYTYCKCGLYQIEMHAYRIDLRFDDEYCYCGVENPYYSDFGILNKEEEELEDE